MARARHANGSAAGTVRGRWHVDVTESRRERGLHQYYGRRLRLLNAFHDVQQKTKGTDDSVRCGIGRQSVAQEVNYAGKNAADGEGSAFRQITSQQMIDPTSPASVMGRSFANAFRSVHENGRPQARTIRWVHSQALGPRSRRLGLRPPKELRSELRRNWNGEELSKIMLFES